MDDATQILPGTGRWQAKPDGGAASIASGALRSLTLAPLHHPAGGSPPRAGEDFI
jgi:hypothetical protein